MPLQKRLPKYGFTSRIGRITSQLRLHKLNQVETDIIDLASLRDADLIKKDVKRVRVFLSGEITRPVVLRGIAVTKGALQAIEAAGGSVES